jgi:hypothetical protein
MEQKNWQLKDRSLPIKGSSQFTFLPELHLKTKLNLKVAKINSKIIISIP